MKRAKNLTSLILIATMWLSISCSSNTTDNSRNYKFPETISLKEATSISLDSTFVKIKALSLTDSLLTVYSSYSNHFINIFNINTGAKLNSYVSIGKGPMEILMANSLYYTRKSKKVSILDDQSQKILTCLITTSNNIEYSEEKKPSHGFVNHLLRDSTYLSLNSEPQAMYSLIRNDRTLNTFFDYPDDGNKISPSKAFAYQGYFLPNEDKTKFVYAGYNSDIVEIYELHDNVLVKLASYGQCYPKYKDESSESSRGVSFSKDSRMGFRDLTYNRTNIYALYSGRDVVNHPETYQFANEIYVFDWNGNQVRKLKLNNDVSKICVDDNDNVIYAVTENENGCSIIRYNL